MKRQSTICHLSFRNSERSRFVRSGDSSVVSEQVGLGDGHGVHASLPLPGVRDDCARSPVLQHERQPVRADVPNHGSLGLPDGPVVSRVTLVCGEAVMGRSGTQLGSSVTLVGGESMYGVSWAR